MVATLASIHLNIVDDALLSKLENIANKPPISAHETNRLLVHASALDCCVLLVIKYLLSLFLTRASQYGASERVVQTIATTIASLAVSSQHHEPKAAYKKATTAFSKCIKWIHARDGEQQVLANLNFLLNRLYALGDEPDSSAASHQPYMRTAKNILHALTAATCVLSTLSVHAAMNFDGV
jgi:hypothetical protein